jgi:hypothetical protein
MITADMPPPFYPVKRFEPRLEFDPFGWTLQPLIGEAIVGFEFIGARVGTASLPDRSVQSARAIGSPWRNHTTSTGIDQSIEVAAASEAKAHHVPGQLADIKRFTSYSWERIADLIGCTRQAVHNWTLGGVINQANRDSLAKLHATIAYIDRGSAEENKRVLGSAYDGRTLIELLEEGRFDEVRRLAGRGSGRQDANWGHVEPKAADPSEHWYTKLVAQPDSDAEPIVKSAMPEASRRLRLRKG